MAAWFVYLARCRDGSLYCGIAIDVAARIAQHDAGRGARYTRGRGPLEVVVVRRMASQGRALRLEHAIKQLAREDKQALAAEPARVERIVRQLRGARPSRTASSQPKPKRESGSR